MLESTNDSHSVILFWFIIEIYNSRSLKETYLDPNNVMLRGSSDTEILLKCIEDVGLSTILSSIDGMFACIV